MLLPEIWPCIGSYWLLPPAASLMNTCRPPLIGLDLLCVISDHLFHIKFFQSLLIFHISVLSLCSCKGFLSLLRQKIFYFY